MVAPQTAGHSGKQAKFFKHFSLTIALLEQISLHWFKFSILLKVKRPISPNFFYLQESFSNDSQISSNKLQVIFLGTVFRLLEWKYVVTFVLTVMEQEKSLV